ncbi:hypothetical protein DTO212C5_7142 [Paecilomyces variotii]|nr:hypothetical protein DTO212C5_7142 [Paecilomyces variotii]
MSTGVSQQEKDGSPPSLTLRQWLHLIGKVARSLCIIILRSIAAPFRLPKGQTWSRYVRYEGMRVFQTALSAVEKQNALPSTESTCRRFSRKRGLSQKDIQLPDGTKVHWIGSPDAPRVIAYFHGGGYAAPALSQHISFLYDKVSRYRDVSILVLSYDLASETKNHYPRQLRQAVSMLNYLINEANKMPSNISLVGNSAGCHLMLGLLLHISHPSPLAPSLEIPGQLYQAILTSPWVTFDVSARSMETNKDKDIICPSALAYWGQNVLSGAKVDPWNTPLSAPRQWWSDLKVGDILILYGGDEVMHDDAAEFSSILKAAHPRTTVYELPGECHEQVLMNDLLHLNMEPLSGKIFSGWMEEHLRDGKS